MREWEGILACHHWHILFAWRPPASGPTLMSLSVIFPFSHGDIQSFEYIGSNTKHWGLCRDFFLEFFMFPFKQKWNVQNISTISRVIHIHKWKEKGEKIKKSLSRGRTERSKKGQDERRENFCNSFTLSMKIQKESPPHTPPTWKKAFVLSQRFSRFSHGTKSLLPITFTSLSSWKLTHSALSASHEHTCMKE